MPSLPLPSTRLTQTLLLLLPPFSILTSLLSTQHLLPLSPHPTLFPHLALHTLVTHQLVPATSPALLLTLLLLHALRPLERNLGPRQYASLLVVALLANALLGPVLLVAVLGPLTRGGWSHLPAGPGACVFAALAVWRGGEVPAVWWWRLVLGEGRRARTGGTGRNAPIKQEGKGGAATPWSLTFSDHAPIYLLALQLALLDFPAGLLPALVGFLVGTAWAVEGLPWGLARWRVPGWVVGEGTLSAALVWPWGWARGARRGRGGAAGGAGGAQGGENSASTSANRERYEGLRRRLEEEGGRGGDGDGMRRVAHASASAGVGVGVGVGPEARRRPMGAQVADYFRGVF